LFILQWLLLRILPRICQIFWSCWVGIYHYERKRFETLMNLIFILLPQLFKNQDFLEWIINL
jgi:hypothetical protein